jgi:ATP-binding cassette, subfamily B, bacterial IrtB/YbtQ
MIQSIRILTDHHLRRFFGPSIFHFVPFLLGLTPYVFVFLLVADFIGSRTCFGADATPLVPFLYYTGIVFCVVLKFLLSKSSYLSVYVLGYELGTDLRIRVGEFLRRLPMGFFKARDPGDITALLLQDIYKLEMNMTHAYQQVISSVALSAVVIAVLAVANFHMSLAMLASVLTALPVLAATQRVVMHFGEKQYASRNATGSRILEYLQGIKVIKAHNQTGRRFRRLDEALKKLKRDSIVLEAIPIPFIAGFTFLLETGYMMLLFLGAHWMLGEAVTAEVFLLFLMVGHQVYETLKRMSIFLPEMRQMDIAGDRIGKVLALEPLPEPEDDPGLDRFDVAFEDVTFRYGNEDVLKGVSFTAPEKSVTALVGPSGAGKSTLMNLIPRFWDVNSGVVRIGGCDVRNLKSARLLSRISMVFQDVYLFQDTVFNNIRLGRTDATPEEVMAAAASAQCHEFIMKLPKGYETVLGEGGSSLSGGEKQRISIARAILKDTPIVLLDEATASLDPENEMLIQQAIEKLVRSKTVIVIAHRLYSICRADQIVVLNRGRLVEIGNHQLLMEGGGLYSRMWELQQKGAGWKLRREEKR